MSPDPHVTKFEGMEIAVIFHVEAVGCIVGTDGERKDADCLA
jgi:4-hydroxy-3-methylbut-2-en-1-yl diphosphate synthase IspG/GcpE